MKILAKIIGSAFGSGFSPVAPGTVGSFVAIAALWVAPPLSTVILILAALLFFFIGVWASAICEQDWGRDPGRVVWDEVVGMMVTVATLPKSLMVYAAAFILFRFFDILKPFPVNRSQQLPGGWGVMIDDVLAGLMGNIVLQILFRLVFTSIAG